MTGIHAGLDSSAISERLWTQPMPCTADLKKILRAKSTSGQRWPASVARPRPTCRGVRQLASWGLPTLASLRVEQDLAARTGHVQLALEGHTLDTRNWEAEFPRS